MQDPFYTAQETTEEYNVLEFFARLWGKRLSILLWGILFALATAGYMLAMTKPYTAEALVRVDSDFFEKGPDVAIDSEVDFIRSRSMFLLALNALGPSVDVSDSDGKSIQTMLSTVLGMEGQNKFSSTQSGFKIDTLLVPDRLLNQKLSLKIEEEGHYALYDADQNLLYRDVDTIAGVDAAKNQPVELHVSDITAPAGSSYTVVPRSPKNYIAELQKQLGTEAIGRRERSGFIRLTFSSEHPEFAKAFLSALVDTYIKRAYDHSSMGKLQALTRIEGQLADTKADLEKAENALKDFQLKAGTVDMTAEMQYALQQLMEVENQIRLIKSKQKELSVYYTGAHPSQLALTDQLRYLESERARKQSTVDQFPQTQATLLKLKREVETFKQIYETTSEKLTEMRNDAASITGYAKVIDEPELLPGGSMFTFFKNLIAGFVAGCLLGAVLAYLKHFSPFSPVHGTEQLDMLGDLPVLGRIHRTITYKTFWRDKSQRRVIPILTPGQAEKPSLDFSHLQRNLGFATFSAGNPVILITSRKPGHGPAAIAANIGALSARTQRTLVIDCSFQERGINKFYKVDATPGLSDVMVGKAPLTQAIRTLDTNYHFIAGGGATSYGAHMLQHPLFVDILKEFAKSYRQIIIYYPGLREDMVTSNFVQYVGSIAFVVSAGETVERMRRFLSGFRHLANVKGIILDDVR